MWHFDAKPRAVAQNDVKDGTSCAATSDVSSEVLGWLNLTCLMMGVPRKDISV